MHDLDPRSATNTGVPDPRGAQAPDGRGAFAPEARGAFGGFIGPKNLVALVRNAAPYLFDGTHPLTDRVPDAGPSETARLHELGAGPLGWWTILREHERLVASERSSFSRPRCRSSSAKAAASRASSASTSASSRSALARSPIAWNASMPPESTDKRSPS